MLVLKRRDGEEIVIGEEIRVRVLDSRPGNCRLGIEAPRNVNVRRAELSPDPSLHDTSGRPLEVPR